MTHDISESVSNGAPDVGVGLVAGHVQAPLTEQQRADVIDCATQFAKAIASSSPGACLVITGQFTLPRYGVRTVDEQVMECCRDAFGYQTQKSEPGTRTINVLLDSTGGSLDSAFKTVRFLSWYADELNVYVPRKAKSASTLLALGARRIFLSPFGELGPLDTQIPDPRNPSSTYVSALDCYQSVDYVRQFGIATMSRALSRLSDDAHGQTALSDLLDTASTFGIGAITPMMKDIRSLDFGAWGRSLQIGERYAQAILRANPAQDHATEGRYGSPEERAEKIAARLVYQYTHHLRPIDIDEAKDVGLETEVMSEEAYDAGLATVELSAGKSFVELVSEPELSARRQADARRREQGTSAGGAGRGVDADRAWAVANTPDKADDD